MADLEDYHTQSMEIFIRICKYFALTANRFEGKLDEKQFTESLSE